MRIEVLYFKGCPNHRPTVDLVRTVVADLRLHAEIKEVEVRNTDDAKRLRFLGSPSVHINDVDIEPEARMRTDYPFGCRMYGASGVPPRALLEAALKEVRQ